MCEGVHIVDQFCNLSFFCVCYAPDLVGALTGIRMNSVSCWLHWFPRRYSQEGRARVDPGFVNADAILPNFVIILHVQIGVQLVGLLALADFRRLYVIRCQLTTLPVNIRSFTKKESICCSSVVDKTGILTFYWRHFIKFNIITFAKSLLVLRHNIIHWRFCKTGYASLFGVGLHNIGLNRYM